MRATLICLMLVLFNSIAFAQLDQDDIVIDPGGGKIKISVIRGTTANGAGKSMKLRDDVMNEEYYMCASSSGGSEETAEVVIVTDKFGISPRVVILKQEGDFVRVYVNGTPLLGNEYACDHDPDNLPNDLAPCKNAGFPEELSGQLETKKFYWIDSSGQLKSDKQTKIQILNASQNTGC